MFFININFVIISCSSTDFVNEMPINTQMGL